MHLQRVRRDLGPVFGDVRWIEGSGRTIDPASGEPNWRTAVFITPSGDICKVHEDGSAAANEAAALRVMHDAPTGVETPRLHATGTVVTGESWLLMSRLAGEPVSAILGKERLETPAGISYYRALGALVAAVSDLPAERFGPLAHGVDDFVSHRRAASERELTAARMACAELGTEGHLDELAEIQRDALDGLVVDHPVITHGDLGVGNVFGHVADGSWVLTGVVDWETAQGSVAEEEFAWPAFAGFESETLAAFVAGFRSTRDVPLSPRAILYFVIDRVYRVRSRLSRSPWLLNQAECVTRSILAGDLPRV